MNAVAAEPPGASAALAAHGLGARVVGNPLFADVSLAVAPGEIFVIMGPSGCGKSTLLRQLIGLARPATGTVHLLGTPLAGLGRQALLALRKRIGVAFQGGALLSSLTVLENIQLPLRHHTRLDAATIRIMCHLKLELLNLSGIDDRMPAELSGGMLKRVSLARAVIMDPEILFLDEPAAGLDPLNAMDLDHLLLKLRAALGVSMVVVTHSLESALRIADRILILIDGSVLAVGAPAEIQRHPDRRVQDLLTGRAPVREPPPDEYLARLMAG